MLFRSIFLRNDIFFINNSFVNSINFQVSDFINKNALLLITLYIALFFIKSAKTFISWLAFRKIIQSEIIKPDVEIRLFTNKKAFEWKFSAEDADEEADEEDVEADEDEADEEVFYKRQLVITPSALLIL